MPHHLGRGLLTTFAINGKFIIETNLLLNKPLQLVVQHILYIIRKQQLKCIHAVVVLATHSCWEQLWSLPQVQPIQWQLAQGDPFYKSTVAEVF